jgi:hypothetical protein
MPPGPVTAVGPRQPWSELALVVTGPPIATGLAALVTLRIAQPICLGIQQGVQRLLHAAAHHAVEVALDPLFVNRDTLPNRLGVSSVIAASFC